MPSNINVMSVNIRLTGTNVQVAQRAVDFTITFTKDDGTPGSHVVTSTFPNRLAHASIPAGWLQEQLVDLLYRAERIIAGIDVVT